jgi:hypothetical protein
MRRLWILALGLWLAPLLSALAADELGKPADKATCGSHGTAIDFMDTPSEAARQAKKDEKLVFVLHVSGHFEDPRFT